MFTSLLTLILAFPGLGATTYEYRRVPVQDVNVNNIPLTAFGEISVAEHTPEVQMMFPYGFNEHIASVTFSEQGSTTSVNNTFTLQTALSTGSMANLCSIKPLRYTPGAGAHCFQTAVFTAGVAGSTQTIGCVSKDWHDGYGFGYNGTSFGIFHSSAGYTTWVASSSWNVDKMDGTGPSKARLDATAGGSIYSVNYQYLGYGMITYAIETQGTGGQVVPVHRVDYAGTQQMPHSQNPSLSLCAKVQNHSNTSQLRLTVPSHGAFREGKPANGAIEHSTAAIQLSVGVARYPILTIRSTETFRGLSNRVLVRLSLLSIANESTNRSAEFDLVKNGVLTGAVWIPYQGLNHSVIDADSTATAITGGEDIMPFYAGPGDAEAHHLEEFEVILSPGEWVSVVGSMDTGTADLKAALRWKEEF